jgi:hypothetical protein
MDKSKEWAEFEMHGPEGFMLAGTSGPRDEALSEMRRYVAQYAEEGPLRVYEVHRVDVTLESFTL